MSNEKGTREMNANELADELTNVGWNKQFSNWELLDQAATMLRQLQAELTASQIHDRRGWDYAEEIEKERRQLQAENEKVNAQYEELKRAYLILSGKLSDLSCGGGAHSYRCCCNKQQLGGGG